MDAPRTLACVATLTLACVATPIAAQSRIETRIDTTLVTVGDRITLDVTVEHPSDAVVVWPDSLDLAPFEVVEAEVRPMRPEGARAQSGASFSVTAFELGEVEVPAFELTVRHADGREETLETDRFGVEVLSVGVEEEGDIREIRGPLAIPMSALRVLAWGLLFALVAAVLYALAQRYRRRPGGEPVTEAGPPPRPPHEVALEELARLEASPLLEEGRVKEYHIRVAEILRRYVEAHYRIAAPEMTTGEVVRALEAAGVDVELRCGLRRFLDRCDLVKFAKVRPEPSASRELLALGRTLVERSAAEGSAGEGPAAEDPPSERSVAEGLAGEPSAPEHREGVSATRAARAGFGPSGEDG